LFFFLLALLKRNHFRNLIYDECNEDYFHLYCLVDMHIIHKTSGDFFTMNKKNLSNKKNTIIWLTRTILFCWLDGILWWNVRYDIRITYPLIAVCIKTIRVKIKCSASGTYIHIYVQADPVQCYKLNTQCHLPMDLPGFKLR